MKVTHTFNHWMHWIKRSHAKHNKCKPKKTHKREIMAYKTSHYNKCFKPAGGTMSRTGAHKYQRWLMWVCFALFSTFFLFVCFPLPSLRFNHFFLYIPTVLVFWVLAKWDSCVVLAGHHYYLSVVIRRLRLIDKNCLPNKFCDFHFKAKPEQLFTHGRSYFFLFYCVFFFLSSSEALSYRSHSSPSMYRKLLPAGNRLLEAARWTSETSAFGNWAITVPSDTPTSSFWRIQTVLFPRRTHFKRRRGPMIWWPATSVLFFFTCSKARADESKIWFQIWMRSGLQTLTSTARSNKSNH